MAAVRALAAGREAEQPRRHLLATLLALFVPRLGVAGGGGGVVVIIAMIGILAAVAMPAYQDYQQKAAVAGAYSAGRDASAKVEAYLAKQGKIPTLAQAGVATGGAVRQMTLDPETAVLRVVTDVEGKEGAGVLVFEPSTDADKRIAWACTAQGIQAGALAQGCN